MLKFLICLMIPLFALGALAAPCNNNGSVPGLYIEEIVTHFNFQAEEPNAHAASKLLPIGDTFRVHPDSGSYRRLVVQAAPSQLGSSPLYVSVYRKTSPNTESVFVSAQQVRSRTADAGVPQSVRYFVEDFDFSRISSHQVRALRVEVTREVNGRRQKVCDGEIFFTNH